MNRIELLFRNKNKEILSVYFTAGFPALNDTVQIIKELDSNGVEMIEIGIPFSDPLADGPLIQQSSDQALKNGMTVNLLFEQIKDIRRDVKTVLILMGYINPVLQYGMEAFCSTAAEIGIDGIILPDLPLEEYEENYKSVFEKYGMKNIFLIAPQSSDQRILKIDQASDSFIYVVASASTTGTKNGISQSKEDYFKRIKNLELKHPTMIGFGINDNSSFYKACEYADGAIIGSAFIKKLNGSGNLKAEIKDFVQDILIREH